jgi:hypothetical protein
MPQEMPEIYVEESACELLYHIIACMSVAYTEDIGGGTLTCARFYKVLMILLAINRHHLRFTRIIP